MKKYLLLAAMAATLMAPGAAHAKRYNLIMTYGQDIVVTGKDEDVAVHAQCIQNSGGYDLVRLYAKVGANSVLKGSDYAPGNGTYLTAVSLPADSELFVIGESTGFERYTGPIDAGFVLNLTSMHGFTFTAESTMAGVNAGTNDCVLSVNIDAIKKFKTVE